MASAFLDPLAKMASIISLSSISILYFALASANFSQMASKRAFSGKDGEIDGGVKSSILSTLENNKKILAMCMGPTVVAKALEGSTYKAGLSVGSSEYPSPYDIKDIHNQMEALGAVCSNASKTEIMFDSKLNIISVPAYMMEASVSEIFQNISQGIDKL